MTAEIPQRVRALIAEHLGVDKAKVTDEASLADLGADSLDAIELELVAEEEFGIDDLNKKIPATATVREVIELIQGGLDG